MPLVKGVNKENPSSPSRKSDDVTVARKLLAKEREDIVLDYVRNMDENKRRSILFRLENSIHQRVALKQIDGNTHVLGKGIQGIGHEGGSRTTGSSMSYGCLRVMEPQPPKSS